MLFLSALSINILLFLLYYIYYFLCVAAVNSVLSNSAVLRVAYLKNGTVLHTKFLSQLSFMYVWFYCCAWLSIPLKLKFYNLT